MPESYGQLVRHLRDAGLVAFIGAGASKSFTDPVHGKTIHGLPSTAELVARLAHDHSYIDSTYTFSQACFLLKKRENRVALETFIAREIDRPGLSPLPAHSICAMLPFSAYVTTNYDQLLERALDVQKRRYHVITVDDDVTKLRPGSVPIIKLHGSVDQPRTIIAAEDEFRPLAVREPIIEGLLKALLANKVVVFLGYSLTDPDFTSVFNEVAELLGDRAPRSYAVVRDADLFRVEYWKDKGVYILSEDLTQFLRGLLRSSFEAAPPPVYQPREDWINNAFFESLVRIRTAPSETQVVDAFLAHFLEEIQSDRLPLEDVLGRAAEAVSSVMAARPNLVALPKVSHELMDEIRANCHTKDEAETVVAQRINARRQIASGISPKAAKYVQRGDQLLVFSQSVRVLQFLRSVPRGVQAACRIFVAECRPKSPNPFQDALTICEALGDTVYELTIVPDVAIGNLLSQGQVTKVVMGAHAIYMHDGRPKYFVNTCGSFLITTLASLQKVPLLLVADSAKFLPAEADGEPRISLIQEEDLFATPSLQMSLSELQAGGRTVNALNIGYDLCPFPEEASLITELPETTAP